MLPKAHFFLTFLLSIILISLGIVSPFQALIILLAGFLIDVDHWLLYVWEFRDFNIKNSYRWFYKFYISKEKRKFLCIFHTIEALIVVTLLGLKYPLFLAVLVGMLFHILLDLIQAYRDGFYSKEISIIYFLLKQAKNKGKLNKLR